MSKNNALIGLAAVFGILYMSLFIVPMTQNAVVLQLQQPIRVIKEPGLYFKVPLLQQVTYFSKQMLVRDSEPAEVLTMDKKNLLIDDYTMWRIVDPLKFLQTVRDEEGAQARLDDILYSQLRVELGTHDLSDIVSSVRENIMAKVTQESNKKAAEYGIEVVDVRIKRTDLPPEIANSIFSRMRTERERIAKEYRSEGKEEATKIRAQTDKEKVILMADAYKQEQIVRGAGDAEATSIYAESFQKDPEFYGFMRSLEAYKNSLKTDTTILLSPSVDFLEYLNKSR